MKCPEFCERLFYQLYERRLQREARAWVMPKHIGIILDGNRRFARQAGLQRLTDGHARGAEKVREVLQWCYDLGIPVVTIWIFSLDNFKRDADEVEGLMDLIAEKTRGIVTDPDIHRKQVRVKYIGRLELLPERVRAAIGAAEGATAQYDCRFLNIAIAYGGREEITDAFRRYLGDQAAGGRPLAEIAASLKADDLDQYLYTSGQPDPDLIIRTSGEVRLSGFLLWQSAYAEYYFCDSYWPAFRRIDFLRALRAYHQRQRRFGK